MPGGGRASRKACRSYIDLREPFNRAACRATVTIMGGCRRHSKSALQARVDAMVDACTRCGKCVEVCPATGAAGLTAEERAKSGRRHRRRHRHSAAAARATKRRANGRAAACCSGECIEACDYGVNPRFLLHGAGRHGARQERRGDATPRRRRGFSQSGARRERIFRACSSTTRCWQRLGQGAKRRRRRRSDDAGPTSCSTPAATCSRRRTSRCLRSTSWMRSASAMR